MKPVALGQSHTYRVETTHAHTADALGNKGMTVIATPILIGFLELAAHGCIEPQFEPGEGSVGTFVNVRHLAAAPAGAVVEATATVTEVAGRQVTFAVTAKWNDTLLMEGTHGRAVVNLARFFARLGMTPPPT
ncbi:MAG TPA: thioesterase family protein [Alphaproteobacteria bacterium]|nr:thioesterase family protein [Alphaproteobacteria bacterium]